MTYEELVIKVRETYEYADAREIYEHIAVQVNILGEAAGAFYIEVANREVSVEPYDYYDRDLLMTAETSVIADVADRKYSFAEAYERGLVHVQGNMDKLNQLLKIKYRNKKGAE